MSDAALAARPVAEAALAFAPLALPPCLDAPGARIAAAAAFGSGLVLGTTATAATGTGGSILRLDLARGEADELATLPPPSTADLAEWRGRMASPLAATRPDDGDLPVGGVTGLTAFQGGDDDRPCLYAATASLRGGDLLRSETGLGYMRVWSQRRRSPGLAGLSAPVAWGPQLVLWSWAQDDGEEPGLLPLETILGSANPSRGAWDALSPAGFGDPANAGLAAMTAAFGRLHVATANPVRGFQVWSAARRRGQLRSDAWVRALDHGAHRFAMAEAGASLAAFGGDLYVGTATQDDGLAGVPSPGAELVRIGHDGGWELVAGETRLSPQGLKVPLSPVGPGLGGQGERRMLVATGAGHVVAATPGGRMILSRDGEGWEEVPGLAAALRPGEAVGVLLIVDGDLLVGAGARLLRARLPA